MFLYEILIWIKKDYKYSNGKIISKFHLLDLSKVSWKLLWGFNENRGAIHSLFLDIKALEISIIMAINKEPELSSLIMNRSNPINIK